MTHVCRAFRSVRSSSRNPAVFASGTTVAAVLVTAATIQTIDVIIAAENKKQGMMIGGSVGAIVHLVCGAAII